MHTDMVVSEERSWRTRVVAALARISSLQARQDFPNHTIENFRIPAWRAQVVPAQPEECTIVMLVGGPYDGQDIRVTGTELRSGIFSRGGQRCLRTVCDASTGIGATVPTFKFNSERVSMPLLVSIPDIEPLSRRLHPVRPGHFKR